MFKLLAAAGLTVSLLSADTRVKSTITAAGQTTETVVLTKGNRQRLEFGQDAVLIQQCDRKRTLQVDATAKTYFVLPTPIPPPPSPSAKPGQATVNTTITDTGETKPWFGYTARRVKSKVETIPGPVSCLKQPQTVETDGWYIELAGVKTTCTIEDAPPAGACTDKLKLNQTGKAKLGFPVSYTITSTVDGKSESIAMEVTELDAKSSLADALFEAPTEFTDVDARQPGAIRVAVAFPNDKTGQAATLPNSVFQSLKKAGFQPIALPKAAPDVVDARAKQANADFILYADLAELKKADKTPAAPSGKRFGSLVGKATGLLNQKETWEARIDYRIFAIGESSPITTASASAKTPSESFNVKGALTLAANVGMMTMMSGGPMGLMMNMMSGGGGPMAAMMNMPGGMGGMGGMGMGMGMPGAAGGLNPSLGGLSALSRASSLGMGGSTGFSQSMSGTGMPGMSAMPGGMPGMPGMPGSGAAPPSNAEVSKAWQAAVEEMTKAVAAQVKK